MLKKSRLYSTAGQVRMHVELWHRRLAASRIHFGSCLVWVLAFVNTQQPKQTACSVPHRRVPVPIRRSILKCFRQYSSELWCWRNRNYQRQLERQRRLLVTKWPLGQQSWWYSSSTACLLRTYTLALREFYTFVAVAPLRWKLETSELKDKFTEKERRHLQRIRP